MLYCSRLKKIRRIWTYQFLPKDIYNAAKYNPKESFTKATQRSHKLLSQWQRSFQQEDCVLVVQKGSPILPYRMNIMYSLEAHQMKWRNKNELIDEVNSIVTE